jgi:hypothetical protein
MSDNSKIEWTDLPRTVDPRGYVLIRFPSHHRADVRGYVYEHVLVAENMIGRQLRKGEQVRHCDRDPGNNDHANLKIRTLPDNSLIECACGCGSTFARFDSTGRPRKFVSGHNPQTAPTRDALLAALAASPDKCVSAADLVTAAGVGVQATRVALSKLLACGVIDRPRFGYYRLPGSTATFPPLARKRPKHEWGSALPAVHKEALLEDFDDRCAYGCGRKASVWDHLIPWSLGGSFRWPGNAVPACIPCNSAKNGSPPGPWVYRAFASDYSADATLGVVDLAISWGMADPEDFEPAVAEAATR